MDRVSRISSGALASLVCASLAKTGSAIRFGSSVCCNRSDRNGRPTSSRLTSEVGLATSAKRTAGRNASSAAPPHAVPAVVGRFAGPLVIPLGRPTILHVVIMGCGRLGSTLAHKLDARGHSVAVIDQNSDAFRRLGAEFSGITVTGIGFDREV